MKHVRIDMSGKRFGRLVGVKFVSVISGNAMWRFMCDCGRHIDAPGYAVRRGSTRSCGCLKREISISANTTHGMTLSAEFRIWSSLVNRCYNNRNVAFKNYGQRGITVCDEWRYSFAQFYRDMGPRPAPYLTIERNDNDRGYSADNCLWATNTQQSRNRRSVVLNIELAREAKAVRDSGGNLSTWARAHGINNGTAYYAATGRTWKETSTHTKEL